MSATPSLVPSSTGASLPHPDSYAQDLMRDLSSALAAFKREHRGHDQLAAVAKVFKHAASVLDHCVPQSGDHEFFKGERAILRNLQQRSDLNGCLVIVKSAANVAEGDGRVEVSVGTGSKRELLRVKPVNLRLEWHVSADIHVATVGSRVLVRSKDSILRDQVCQVISSDTATSRVTVRAVKSDDDAATSPSRVSTASSNPDATAGGTVDVSVSGLVPAIYLDIAKEVIGCAVKIALQAAGGVATPAISAVTNAVEICARFYIRCGRGPEAARACILFLKTLFKGGRTSSTASSFEQDFTERMKWTYNFVYIILHYVDIDLQAQNFVDEAISVLMLCKEVIHGIETSESYNYFTLLNNLANLYVKQMRLDDAVATFKEALSMGESAFDDVHEGLGETHVLPTSYDVCMAVTMNHLAAVFVQQQRFAEAEVLLKDALEKQELRLGRDSLDLSVTLQTLADLCVQQDRTEAAEYFINESIRIQQLNLGPNSLEESECFIQLAMVYHRQGRFADAETMFLRALRTQQMKLEPCDLGISHTMNRIAIFYNAHNRFSEAEEMYNEAIRIINVNQGPDSLRLSSLLSSFAMLHLHAKRLDEADAMLREALRIKRAHGQECLDVATDLSNLGIVAMKLERYSESEELQKEALRIQESKLGKESMEASRTLSYLAGLYMASNREDEAEAVYKEALRIAELKHGHDHPFAIEMRTKLAEWHPPPLSHIC